MPLVVKNRVMETTSTTGTGTLTLTGAVAGFQSFSVIGNANTTYYAIVSGTNWEVGIGTYTASGTTLSRDTVLESSAGGTTKISVASGAQVFVTYPAEESVDLDTAQTLTNKTLAGAVLNDGYTEEIFSVPSSPTNAVLSPTNGSIQTWTLPASSTPTAGTWAAGQSMTLMIDDGSGFLVTWSTLNVIWETDSGVAPTLATSGFTTIVLWKVGTQIYGARVGNA